MTLSEALAGVRALGFDVFGTVVDWRGSIAREVAAAGQARGLTLDGNAFALAWRAQYQPAMEAIRSGRRPFTPLDVLHRENLLTVLDQFGVRERFDDAAIDELNRAWHRLAPWPDAVPGLTRLKRRFPLVTLSNGNVALLVNLARHAGLPWDAILGAEPCRAYKPQPQAYLGTADYLGLPPGALMLVAAHDDDLGHARAQGLRTAFVPRPTEYEDDPQRNSAPRQDWDLIASDFGELAARLGC